MPPQSLSRLLLVVSLLVFLAAAPSDNRPVRLSIPANFPQPAYDFNKFPLTKPKIALGRKLFYDPLLSRDGSVSCGSCHQQASAFTQHGHRLSHGINDSLTRRNSMPLMNLAWQDKFGWDGAVPALSLFSVTPIQHPNEMGDNLVTVRRRLRQDETYRKQFLDAFATDAVGTEHLLEALAQFMLTLVSADSRYDQWMRREPSTPASALFTKEEQKGLSIFRQKCSSCHSEPFFTDFSLRNNGLKVLDAADKGMGEISQKSEDNYKFKVPSLRNVALTAPYMHDGRFETLEAVLEHYSSGVQNNGSVDSILVAAKTPGIRLSKEEKKQLLAFLATLTDEAFITNEQFAEPETETMYLERINFAPATIHPQVAHSLQPLVAKVRQLEAAIREKQPQQAAQAATDLKQALEAVSLENLTEAQRSFLTEQQRSMVLHLDHIIRIHEVGHQQQHGEMISKGLDLLNYAFKFSKS